MVMVLAVYYIVNLMGLWTGMMKDLGYGKGYAYDHDAAGNFSGQECMPQGMEGTTFYVPGNNPREQQALAWLKARWGEKYGY